MHAAVSMGEEGKKVMKCEEFEEMMLDLSSGTARPEIDVHMADCGACAAKMTDFQQTMALLDEWTAPDPSQYFDVRLQARLREEMAKQPASWTAWFRRPALAAALTLLLAIGGGIFYAMGGGKFGSENKVVASMDLPAQLAEPGSAVGDLQALEKNHELYSDFDLLDDLQVQSDVTANP